jgi:hypothetical protein
MSRVNGNLVSSPILPYTWIQLMRPFPDLESRERAAYEAAARSMNLLIDLFRKQLPPLPEFNTQDPGLRMNILTHALIDAAAIKLHWLFAYAWSTSRQICLAAARNLVSYKLNLQELGHFNPIMGVCIISLPPLFVTHFIPEFMDDCVSRFHRRNIQSSA